MRLLVFGLLLITVGTACSSSEPFLNVPPSETAATTPPHEVASTTTTRLSEVTPELGVPGIVEWQYVGTVIDAGEPILCSPVVLLSLPPQCGGVPVVGLDWSAVDWSDSEQGVTWADLTLIGTFDGREFELTRPPAPPVRREETPVVFPLPCDEPPGGWQVINPATADNESAAVVYAQAQPEFMASWTHRLPSDAAVYSVKVYTFTDRLEEHEQAIRDFFGDALCVGRAHRSLGELEAIRSQVKQVLISPEAKAAGIYLVNGGFSNTIDGRSGTIEVHVFAAEAGAQGWLDWQFGEGVVNLHSRLQRVGGAG